jgi:hypothetical protein
MIICDHFRVNPGNVPIAGSRSLRANTALGAACAAAGASRWLAAYWRVPDSDPVIAHCSPTVNTPVNCEANVSPATDPLKLPES